MKFLGKLIRRSSALAESDDDNKELRAKIHGILASHIYIAIGFL